VINELRLRVGDVNQTQALAADLERKVRYRSESWQEANQNFLNIFVIQNGIMYSTVSAILIVAGFGIFNIISTVINEKQRDIAILKSIGFSERDLRRIFVMQGIMVGMVGSVFGWVLGYGIILFLESLDMKIDGIVRTQGFVMYKSVWHYVLSGVLALISSSIAAYLPARRAAAMNPVEIIRGAA
jgi:lipoprotein-releasing system permease protein